MPDFGLRDLGAIVPGAHLAEPAPPADTAPPRPSSTIDPEPAPVSRRVFVADRPDAADALGLDGIVDLLAELAVHVRTETPLGIGILARPGSGKSLALNKLIRSIERTSQAARGVDATPFLGNILVARIDAADLDGHPATALAGALYPRLATTFPTLAIEASQAAEDPRRAARAAFEKLDIARHKLAAERLALDEAVARRARLTETILHETPGTRIDTYARANRSRIRNRLARFGIKGDTNLAYKDLVHQTIDGDRAKLNFALRSLWAFKGQSKLLVLTLLLVLVGFGLGFALGEQATWLGWLRGNETTLPAARWFEANMSWLATLRQIALIGAALALAANLFRAFLLVQPIFRGRALLQADLAGRQRDADAHFEHQAQRVESLVAEVDDLARRAAAAERRSGGLAKTNPAPAEPSPFGADAVKQQAQRFITGIGTLIQGRGRTRADSGTTAVEVPQRIMIALDNLDAVPPERAREILGHVHRLFGTGFVVLLAADPARLTLGADGGEDILERWIQVPLQAGEIAARGDQAELVRTLLDAATARPAQSPVRDLEISLLDEPVCDAEAELLADLAPLAGSSARAVKRFVNLYRIGRTRCPDHKGMLAMMLALAAGGTQAEITTVNDALAEGKSDLDINLDHGGPRLVEALAAVQRLDQSVSIAAARHAAVTARLFSFKA